MALMAVTGAFSFSGRHIAARLLDGGHEVVNLTNHGDRADPFGGRTRVRPLTFNEDGLAADLAGVDTLFNTYWVRFARGKTDHRLAVDNSRVLLAAAARAGVRRIVHVSIANLEDRPSDPYYAGKGEVEARAARRRPELGDPAAGGPLRRRADPGQLHRLAAAPPAGVPDPR